MGRGSGQHRQQKMGDGAVPGQPQQHGEKPSLPWLPAPALPALLPLPLLLPFAPHLPHPTATPAPHPLYSKCLTFGSGTSHLPAFSLRFCLMVLLSTLARSTCRWG